MLPLLREEALERFRGSTWQPVLLSKPVSGYMLVASAVLAGTCLLGFASSFEFARKEQVLENIEGQRLALNTCVRR